MNIDHDFGSDSELPSLWGRLKDQASRTVSDGTVAVCHVGVSFVGALMSFLVWYIQPDNPMWQFHVLK